MRTISCLLLVACVGPTVADSDPVVIGDSDAPVDPCTTAPELAEWTRALVTEDEVVVHDFRAGINHPVQVALDGALVGRGTEDCPGGFAVERSDGMVVEVDLCVDDGRQLPSLPSDGRAVSGRFEGLDTTRGEFTLVLADADGLLLSMRVDGEGNALAEPWRVTAEADILDCLDGDAFQSLRFAHTDGSAVVDSGSDTELDAGDFTWTLRAHIAGRQAKTDGRHLFDWAGAIYTIQRQ